MCTRIWNPQSLTRLSVTISRLAKNKDVPWRDMGWGMGYVVWGMGQCFKLTWG